MLLLVVAAATSRAITSAISLLSRGLNYQPESLHLFVIHFLHSCLGIIVVLKFLSDGRCTMNEYGPLY